VTRAQASRALASFLLLLGVVSGAIACASTPDSSSTPELAVRGLDETTYAAAVQPVIERRCGSLDCHGKLARGLRVYGENSLRLAGGDGGTVVGGGATTAAEAQATFDSIIGLQPEQTNDFVARSHDPYSLLLLTKPLQLERHRGGISLRKGEPAEVCIRTWLLGSVDAAACEKGASGLP